MAKRPHHIDSFSSLRYVDMLGSCSVAHPIVPWTYRWLFASVDDVHRFPVIWTLIALLPAALAGFLYQLHSWVALAAAGWFLGLSGWYVFHRLYKDWHFFARLDARLTSDLGRDMRTWPSPWVGVVGGLATFCIPVWFALSRGLPPIWLAAWIAAVLAWVTPTALALLLASIRAAVKIQNISPSATLEEDCDPLRNVDVVKVQAVFRLQGTLGVILFFFVLLPFTMLVVDQPDNIWLKALWVIVFVTTLTVVVFILVYAPNRAATAAATVISDRRHEALMEATSAWTNGYPTDDIHAGVNHSLRITAATDRVALLDRLAYQKNSASSKFRLAVAVIPLLLQGLALFSQSNGG